MLRGMMIYFASIARSRARKIRRLGRERAGRYDLTWDFLVRLWWDQRGDPPSGPRQEKEDDAAFPEGHPPVPAPMTVDAAMNMRSMSGNSSRSASTGTK